MNPPGDDVVNSGYDALYRDFDSPLMRMLRHEAYGEDIGQHSWVSASELRDDVGRLMLTSSSRLLDLGCGPCGPLCYIVDQIRCRGTGTDVSAPALAVGWQRVSSMALADLIALRQGDLDNPLPFQAQAFDAVMALDVVLHVRNREQLFREIARLLPPSGRLLFTDAAVVTGSISDQEVVRRSMHGHTQFSAQGFNEGLLASVGFTSA